MFIHEQTLVKELGIVNAGYHACIVSMQRGR
ncbi:hypothetical protein FHS15_001862 [Paenibacillus castaneae]|nr:hypothetical protein [Paenibacillus castaneae]